MFGGYHVQYSQLKISTTTKTKNKMKNKKIQQCHKNSKKKRKKKEVTSILRTHIYMSAHFLGTYTKKRWWGSTIRGKFINMRGTVKW